MHNVIGREQNGFASQIRVKHIYLQQEEQIRSNEMLNNYFINTQQPNFKDKSVLPQNSHGVTNQAQLHCSKIFNPVQKQWFQSLYQY
ncbi:unnamed protein product [Paramecium octaurelia]|uniref:Uncharacterized protein n=1 Tax=Paramecium octaurelia TaxID=43137 RepID=A0A8S1W0E2_PAROT|nr:unnamed protein product [Paramecium octaurelia]